ncbi:MAG: endolytic transglycosylase MltG [Candidatus Humimicrobiaceae bacterium]
MRLKKINNKINKIITLLLILILSMSSGFASSCFLDTGIPEDKTEVSEGIEVEVIIIEGMTLDQIAAVLEDNQVVDNGFMFRLYVQQKGKEKSLVPGTYNLLTGSEYGEVMDDLSSGPAIITFTVAIPEGYIISDIVERFSSELPFIDIDEMLLAVNADNYNYDYIENDESLEGYLFPKTYEVTMDYNAHDIVDMMLAQYRYETGDLDYADPENNGFSKYDILKIASMIEREAYIPEERELISAVIHNRLNIGMPLGIDATLTYFLEKWDELLTVSDLETDTGFNTRLYAGLPPTPICNPGLAAIIAAIKPADVDYLYFVVTDSQTHEHSFTNNYDEHINNINNAN